MRERVAQAGPESARRLSRFRLLASAIAGRALDVAPALPGEAPWTDGSTLFMDASPDARDGVIEDLEGAVVPGGPVLTCGVVLRRAVRGRFHSASMHITKYSVQISLGICRPGRQCGTSGDSVR